MWPKNCGLIAALLCSVSVAFSKYTDDIICLSEGPVSGVAEELPDAKVKKEMVDETNELSNSMSNSLLRFELFAPVSLGLERDVKSGNLAQDPTGLTNWLAHPKQMLAQRDPVVMQLYGEWNEILMPNLHLSEIEISARIEHMNAETYKVTQGESA